MADTNKSSASSSWLPVLLICCWAVSVCLMSAKGSAAQQHHVSAAAAAAAPAPAAAAAADCSSALLNLADCLTFVEEGSKVVKPQGQCCPGLKKVLKGEVSCLCQAFRTDYGIKLNMTKALTLQAACGFKSPPFSKCSNSELPSFSFPLFFKHPAFFERFCVFIPDSGNFGWVFVFCSCCWCTWGCSWYVY